MGDAKSIKSNFEIVDRKEYIDCIKIEKKKYSTGRGALDASLYFDRLTKENLIVNLGKDNVDDNSRNGYLTLKNINSILCLFFHKDSKIDHEVNHVKRFLKNLKYHDKKMEDKIAFDNFIKLIRPHLTPEFNEYNYTLNPITWKFEITNIDSLPIENIDINSSKNQDELELKKLEIEKFLQLKKEQEILNNHRNKRKKIVISFFFIIIIGIVGHYINSTIQKKAAQEQKILQERNIIENAKEKSSSRTVLLSDIYSTINQELKEDYNNDGIKNLSEELIGRIISLSGTLTPYKYKRDNEIVKYSPERASLFNNIIRYKLSIRTYQSIFNEADFSFSDFSGLDFSKLNLIRLVNGIAGNHANNAQLLITIAKRPNLKKSSFKRTNLNGSKLYGDFSGSDFTDAKLEDLSFEWSKVSKAKFTSKLIVFKVFNSDFSDSFFNQSKIYCKISNSDFRGVHFNKCEFLEFWDFFDNIMNRNDSELSYWLQTFTNVYFSTDELISEYEVVIGDIAEYSSGFLGRTLFNGMSYNSNNTTMHYKVPIDLIKMKNGKEKAILNRDFRIIGKDFTIDDYVNLWKSSNDNFSYYIVRSNDNYYDKMRIIDDNKKIIHFDSIEIELDTFNIISGKDFICYKWKEDNINCGNYLRLKSKKGKTLFNNCIFNKVSFKTKISGASFKGSNFIDVLFKDSELYNLDFKGVKGSVFFNKNTLIDSLHVDKNFYWMSIKDVQNKMLNEKSDFLIKNYTLRQHLIKLKEAKKDEKSMNYWSSKLNFLHSKYLALDTMSKKIIIKKLNSKSDFIIRDKDYINLLEIVNKQSKKNH